MNQKQNYEGHFDGDKYLSFEWSVEGQKDLNNITKHLTGLRETENVE